MRLLAGVGIGVAVFASVLALAVSFATHTGYEHQRNQLRDQDTALVALLSLGRAQGKLNTQFSNMLLRRQPRTRRLVGVRAGP